MKKLILTAAVVGMMCGCQQKQETNPFFAESTLEYGAPNFSKIKFEDYEPAFMKGIEEQNADIQAIIDNKEAPTFENTVVALDNSGVILSRVNHVFDALTSADTNDSLTALSEKMAPILTEHVDNIYLNKELFKRFEAVHNDVESGKVKLTTEQQRLLDKYYRTFLRSGAALDEEKQSRLKEVNKELSSLGVAYNTHVLNANNEYKLLIDNQEDLAGLPESVIAGAAESAKEDGNEGKWLFTLQKSSFIPFLQYAENRELRKQIYEAYTTRCMKDNKDDNREVLKKILTLRLEKAHLMGYDCYANYVLEECMAKNDTTVMNFLNSLWGYSLKKAKEEAAELQKIMDREKKGEKLQAWDWWYYAEKLRKEKYDIDESKLKEYFSLEDVRKGLFYAANKMYGIKMVEVTNLPVYASDIKVFKVEDADGSLLGLFYSDYTPRAGKRGGAWMSNFREQVGDQRPIIYNVASFTKPTGDTPALLSLREVETMFHEFGHALHGLLTKCNYLGTSGTNVARDFVELPSQFNEHWAFEPEVLKVYAKNYKTGEVIPDSLIEKIERQSTFNQGFLTTELLAASILDMNMHMLTNTDNLDVMAFEKECMDKIGLIPEIAPRYRSTYFTHIIGGYEAGYYSYLWAEVLDADAFESFRQNGIFDPETCKSFRTNILEKGDTDDPMVLYKNFKGAEPNVEPLLKNRGLK